MQGIEGPPEREAPMIRIVDEEEEDDRARFYPAFRAAFDLTQALGIESEPVPSGPDFDESGPISPGWVGLRDALAGAYKAHLATWEASTAAWSVAALLKCVESRLPPPRVVGCNAEVLMIWHADGYHLGVRAWPEGQVDYSYHDFHSDTHLGPSTAAGLAPPARLRELISLAAGLGPVTSPPSPEESSPS